MRIINVKKGESAVGKLKLFLFVMNLCLLIAFLFFVLIQGKLYSQELMKNVFSEKKQVGEIRHNEKVRSVIASSRYIAVLSDPNEVNGIGNVTLYDLNGNKLWNQRINAGQISMGKNADRVIVNHSLRYDYLKSSCYDLEGNKLWEVSTTDPGLTMSDNGKYGITTRIAHDEEGGKFQVFDLSNGNEINIPIEKDYNYFRAKFLNDQEVVVLIQKMIQVRDEECLKEVNKRINEYYEESLNEQSDDRGEKRWDKIKMGYDRRKCIEDKMLPLKLIIYDIPTNTIKVDRELTSENGDSVWVYRYESGIIEVSDDGKHFTLEACYGEYKPETESTLVYLINDKGIQLWESKNYRKIISMKLIDKKYVILEDWNGRNSIINLISLTQGRRIWSYTYDAGYLGGIQKCLLKNDNIYIQTSYGIHINPKYLFMNLKTGQNVADIDKNESLIFIERTTDEMDVLLDRASNQILFLK